MCKFRILRILRNDHGVGPLISSAFRHVVSHVFILIDHICRISGIDQTKCLPSLCHVINDLIGNDLRLHGLYTLNQPVIRFLDLAFVRRIHRISQCLQCHHKGISL